MDDGVKDALRRRALGFETDEVVEEYAFQEGEAVLLKRKVTKKTVPPDVAAAKLLSDEEKPLSALSPGSVEGGEGRVCGSLRGADD